MYTTALIFLLENAFYYFYLSFVTCFFTIMASGLMWRVLVTAKDSAAAVDTLQDSQSKPLAAGPAAHKRRLRDIFGSPSSQAPRPPAPSATTIRQIRTSFVPRPRGRASHRRALASNKSSPPTEAPSLPYPASEPRFLAPDPPAPPEPAHSRPPASLPNPPGHRSSKTSLGYISTPLIWQGRKRPIRGRRPTATRAPPRPVVHITKPTAQPTELKNTVRPTSTTQEGGFKHTAGYTTHMLAYVTHTTAHLHASAQPTSRPNFSHQPIPNEETPSTTQDSKLPPESGLSSLSQGSSLWQHNDEAVESSSVVGAAPLASSSSSSALSNRKNKPVAPQWSLLSMSSRDNQTVATSNWTHPVEPLGDEYSSGSEPFVYDLTELSLYEFDAAFSSDEPATVPPAFMDLGTKHQQTLNRSDPLGAIFPVSEGGSEVLAQRQPKETLGSGLAAGKLSLPHSQDRLIPETVKIVSRSHIPTPTVSQTLTVPKTHQNIPNNTISSEQTREEISYTKAVTQQPTTSLLIPPLSSLLFIQPTPSLPMLLQSSSTFFAEETFPRQIFSSSLPQKEEIAQMSSSSLSLNPLSSDLTAVRSRQFISLYSDISPSSSLSTVFLKTSSSNIFAFPPNIHHYSSSTLLSVIPSSPSLPLLSASSPFTSSHAITASPSVSSVTVTSRPPSLPPLYSSNTFTPLPFSPPVWSATLPLPPSSRHAEQRLSGADGVVESAHVPESDGVSGNFQPSVLSSLSLSSSLQRDFVVTRVDTSSSLSLPLSSKAPTESQMPVVDSALLPEYHLLSAEESSNNIPEPSRSRLPYLEGNQLLDTHSGLFVHADEILLDSSFSQIEPTPSGLSVGNLAFSTEVLAPDLSPQTEPALGQLELLDSELGFSGVLWPSSHSASLSVSQFLVHSDQRGLSDIHTLPYESRPLNQSSVDFTSLTTAGIWALERTLTLLHANIERMQPVHSALSSIIPSSNPLSHQLQNLSLTVSTETLPVATMMQEQMVGEETAASSSSLSLNPVVENSPLLAQTSSSRSQDRHTSNLTFNRDLSGLQQAISPLHTNNQVNRNFAAGATKELTGYDNAYNCPSSPVSNPSVMATTQTLVLHSSTSVQLGTETSQHASGLDYMYQSGLTQTNTEHLGHLIHTHSSAHTQMHTHLGARMFFDASEKLNLSQRLGQEAEAQIDIRGRQQQSSHFISFSFTPPLLSPSILPSFSLSATLTPPFPSLQISPDITVSSLSLSSVITPSLSPLLSGRVALPAASASMEEAEIGSLSPSWLIEGFQQPTTTQSPLGSHLQSLQRSTTYPVIQSTQSIQQFIPVSQSLPPDQVSTLPDDRLKSIDSNPLVPADEYDDDEVSLQLTNSSQTADTSGFISGAVPSPEASNDPTAAGKLLHLSALFDPANVVPKIHIAVELASSSAVSTNDSEAALNTQSFPVEMQTTSACPTSQPSYQPSSAVTEQTTGAPVIPNPLHTSGLNISSFTPVSRSPTGSFIEAPGQGFISKFEELPPPGSDNQTANAAALKNISMSNATTLITLKVPETTNTTKNKNATTILETGSMEAPQGNLTGSKPAADLGMNAGTSANLTVSKPDLNSSPSVSNHSGSQSSGASGVKDANLSPTLPALVSAHHFTTTKNSSSPTAPFKAGSAAASSSSLKKATARPAPGSPTVDLAAKPALPCQCKQRFHFTCLCGLSSGNSMSCSNKKKPVDVENQKTIICNDSSMNCKENSSK